jgi:hypothetical protein
MAPFSNSWPPLARAWNWPPTPTPWQWPPIPRPPLPADAVFYLDAEMQCRPSVWIDQIGGRLVPGVGTPVVGVRPGFFNNRPCAQTFQTGSYWGATYGSPICLAGTRPWMQAVFAIRTIDATSRFIAGVKGPATQSGLRVRTPSRRGLWSSLYSVDGAPLDTLAHTGSTWLDGANCNILYSGVLNASGAPGGVMTEDLTGVYIGANPSGPGPDFTDCDLVSFLITRAEPSAGAKSAMNAYIFARWGVT